MPKCNSPLTNFSSAFELRSCRGNHQTGFSLINKSIGFSHSEKQVPHNYMLFLLSGRLSISCDLFENKILEEGCTVLIPNGGSLKLSALTNIQLLIFVFDVTLMKTEIRLLRHVCKRAYNTDYRFVSLPIHDIIKEQLHLIVKYITDSKILNLTFFENMNAVIFILFVSYYDWNSVSDYFHFILNSKLDFKTFILNNYEDAQRSVERLIILSGLPESTFHKKFKNEFGETPKQWMMQRDVDLLISEIREKGTTIDMVMEKLKLNNMNQLRLICKKYLQCSPSELINCTQNIKQPINQLESIEKNST